MRLILYIYLLVNSLIFLVNPGIDLVNIDLIFNYLMINVVLILIISVLRFRLSELPFWIILITYIFGYHTKISLLIYLFNNSKELGLSHFPLEMKLLGKTDLLNDYFLVNISFLLAIYFVLILKRIIVSKNKPKLRKTTIKQKDKKIQLRNPLITHLFIFSCLIFQIKNGVNLVSIESTNNLPKGIPTLLGLITNEVFFISIFWYIDSYTRSENSSRKVSLIYKWLISFTLLSSFLTTSKEPIIRGLILYLIISVINGKNIKVLISQLKIPIILIIPFFSILSVRRTIRSLGYSDLLDFDNLQNIVPMIFNWDVVSNIFISTLTRINGADATLNILNHLNQKGYHLFEVFEKYGFDLNLFYTQEILGYNDISGIGFSTSILGYILLVFTKNKLLVFFGSAIVLTFVLNVLKLLRLPTLVLPELKPILIGLSSYLLFFFISEGSIHQILSKISFTLFSVIFSFFLMKKRYE